MKCENCNIDHDGKYGSGRFCSCKCARGFGTKEKRKEINDKVSKKLKGKPSSIPIEKRKYRLFTEEDHIKASDVIRNKHKNLNLERLEKGEKIRSCTLRPILLELQQNKCAICGMIPIWNGNPISFDIDHIDGNPANCKKENLRAICPNCHRQTETFGGKNMGKHNAREYMKKYLNYDERRKILSNKSMDL